MRGVVRRASRREGTRRSEAPLVVDPANLGPVERWLDRSGTELERLADGAGALGVAEVGDGTHFASIEAVLERLEDRYVPRLSFRRQLDLDQLHPLRCHRNAVCLMTTRVSRFLIALPCVASGRVSRRRSRDGHLVSSRLAEQIRLAQPGPRVRRPHE